MKQENPVTEMLDLLFSPTQQQSLFDRLRHTERDQEYWLARELQEALGYVEWRKFEGTIERAKAACKNCGNAPENHFVGADKMIEIGSGVQRQVDDYRMTRFACYLVAMNGDPRKEEIARAQAYFAIKTHEAETQAHRSTVTQGGGLRAVRASYERLTLHEQKRFVEWAIADIRLSEPSWEAPKPVLSMALTSTDDYVLKIMGELREQLPLPAYALQRHMYQEHRGEMKLNAAQITDSLSRLAYHQRVVPAPGRKGERVFRWELV